MMSTRIALPVAAILVAGLTPALSAQTPGVTSDSIACAKVSTPTDHVNMDHAAHQMARAACASTVPTMPGQAAFGAISEIVAMLRADPRTDWTRVNIEALRQHFIDMDRVIMSAQVTQRNIPRGLEMVVTGTGATVAAIKRMVINHARALGEGQEYVSRADEIRDGARITVTATGASDSLVARIRGLGFAGLLTEGNHHAAHHLALARGDAPHKH